MDYDQWKLETPDEEDERINGRARRRMERQEYLADLLDGEQREMERKNVNLQDYL
jgi:hypothetical protein